MSLEPNRLERDDGAAIEVTLQASQSTSITYFSAQGHEQDFSWHDFPTEKEARRFLSLTVAEFMEKGYRLVSNWKSRSSNGSFGGGDDSGSTTTGKRAGHHSTDADDSNKAAKRPNSGPSLGNTEPHKAGGSHREAQVPKASSSHSNIRAASTSTNGCSSSRARASPPSGGSSPASDEDSSSKDDSTHAPASPGGTCPAPLNDLAEGQSTTVQSQSSSSQYTIKNCGGGVFSCSCPAWRNQRGGNNVRSCKHIKEFRGDAAEEYRLKQAGVTASPASAHKPSQKKGAASSNGDDGGGGAAGIDVMLAEKWDGVMDPTGWWMSEKLDGMRAYWNGKVLVSRLGNKVCAPAEFTEDFPKDAELDGEIYLGKGEFSALMSIVKNQSNTIKQWEKVTYVVFDAPNVCKPFEGRLDVVKSVVAASGSRYMVAHPHYKCASIQQLKSELKKVEDEGGEGLMLRKPGSDYERKRTKVLLKVKSFQDAEAVVIGHEPGKGKYKDMTGALLCKDRNGMTFKVGTGMDDKTRAKPPAIGVIITYRYFEITKDGKPRFPSYAGVRVDPPPM